MIQIQRTKFAIFEKFKNKPRNIANYTFYKDEYYTCGKFTYPISIFFDILESQREVDEFRYLVEGEDGSYYLFMPPYEAPIRLEKLDKDILNRITLFSAGLETLNFTHTGLVRTDTKLIISAIKKMPKITSRYGFVYFAASIAIVYFLAFGTIKVVFGFVEEQLSLKTTTQAELQTQLTGLQIKQSELDKQLGDNGEGEGLSLHLPKPFETFVNRATRGDKLEQDAVITTPPPPKDEDI